MKACSSFLYSEFRFTCRSNKSHTRQSCQWSYKSFHRSRRRNGSDSRRWWTRWRPERWRSSSLLKDCGLLLPWEHSSEWGNGRPPWVGLRMHGPCCVIILRLTAMQPVLVTLPRIHFDPNFLQLAKITYNPLVYIYTSGLRQFLKKSTDVLEKYGIFRVFWPILGLFLILSHFRAVFWGGFKFFGH